ncbi:EF-hand domain-containing protein [Rhodobacteraceae bacterium N5(2021)]|uniref:EF-hand domain-containing protein n=2 Tax=Gymnodinialimonas phycosphaerae TaxID=2841589 RepID=A0A975YI05_9RHOB|nr:EF-hand domain-containing protein [Gymnodinialimonas phycosphaerae]
MPAVALGAALSFSAAPALAAPGDHFIVNWDLDGDGVVTVDEIRTRRGDVFFTFDADENGAIDGEEYVMFDEARENDMANEPGHGSGSGNGNGNGGGNGSPMQRAAAGMTLEFNDVDGNGEVSEAEFLAQAAAWLQMLDRNGDGIVTTDDFGRR